MCGVNAAASGNAIPNGELLPGSVCRANNLPPYFDPSETEKNGDAADWVRGDVRAPLSISCRLVAGCSGSRERQERQLFSLTPHTRKPTFGCALQ